MNSQNISFENTKENLLKELQIKIDEKFNIEKNDIKILSDLIEEEKRDRVSSFEKFLMQNYQKEQILNNLTDGI